MSVLRHRAHVSPLLTWDPVLVAGMLAVGAFMLTFVVWPLGRVLVQGALTTDGYVSLEPFQRYIDPRQAPYYRRVVYDTLRMGLLSASGGTALGLLFAYCTVHCRVPGKSLVHLLALLPTISPPFALALAAILLLGRNGLLTRRLLADSLGIDAYGLGFDLFGMTGLVFVQMITYFSVAYLILRGMLERFNPALDEAAENLGASKWQVLRTITLPMLMPGLAGSFLLLFVESLADLGNPLFIAGNTTVLSAQIFLAINGEYDQQKGAALSLVLLLPTLTVFVLQRYWLSRRSYVTVTGKPASRPLPATAWYVRCPCIGATYGVLGLIVALYLTLAVGSLTRVWGVDYTPDFRHYATALTRGLEAFIDTTFLSAVATPLAGVLGMLIAYLVVRTRLYGKALLDFVSNLGGAVPGTVLGIGYILAFIKPPIAVVGLLYVLFVSPLAAAGAAHRWGYVALLGLGSGLGQGLILSWRWYAGNLETWLCFWAALLVALGILGLVKIRPAGRWRVPLLLAGMGLYLLAYTQINLFTAPLAAWGRQIGGMLGPKIVTNLAEAIEVFFRPPLALLGLSYALVSAYVLRALPQHWRLLYTLSLMAMSYALIFVEAPLVLVGTPYIIIMAYAVRSLPASVRAGIAALQQIDPAIEEASTNLGADTGYTWRHVTLPLIFPAFVAGLIFSFTRHMTSLSAIIFLTNPRWRILTALILSEVEQGGISVAAAYSVLLIGLVSGTLGVMSLVVGRAVRTAESTAMALGTG